MKVKQNKTAAMIALLLAAIIAIGLFSSGCVSGLMPIGWSGGVVSDGILYIGSLEGRLVTVDLTDLSILRADKLATPTQGGLFGCSLAGSCGGGTTSVPIYGTPVVSDNLVYIAGYNGRVYAYNTNKLATRWTFPRDNYAEAFVGGLAVADGKLFFGCSDGYIYALDAATGDLLYYYKTEDKIWGSPVVDDDTLYIGSFDKKFYALNTADLTLKWVFITEGSIIAKPLVSNGTIYIGSFDRNLYALNASDGTLKWKFMAQNWFWSQPVIVNDILYVGCLDGFIYALKPSNGELIKAFPIGSQLASQPVVFDNYIIFASHNGGIFKIDSNTQDIVLLTSLESITIDGPLTLYEGIIYFQTHDAALQRIDVFSGALLPSIPLISQ